MKRIIFILAAVFRRISDIYALTNNVNLGPWQDGNPGTFSKTSHEYYTGYFVSPTHPNPRIDHATFDTSSTITWPAGWWPNLIGTETDRESLVWDPSSPDDYTNEVTYTGVAPPVTEESCDIYISTNWFSPTLGWFWVSNHRAAQATMKLQTGGKSTSRNRNLFGISCAASKINYAIQTDGSLQTTSSSGIPSQNIVLGSYGALRTNGVKYLILPDNKEVDVTPYAADVDYYTFNFGQPQKYHSYFDLFVEQANPGYSLIFYNTTNDVGHVFWRFRTDAPSDALLYLSPNIAGYLDHKWGFYPSDPNNLFTGLGQLRNNDSHSYDIQRSFFMSFLDLRKGLIYTSGLSNSPPVYCLSSFSCVGAARAAGFTVDIFGLPWDTTPQNFGVTLIQMYPAPGQISGRLLTPQMCFIHRHLIKYERPTISLQTKRVLFDHEKRRGWRAHLEWCMYHFISFWLCI